MPAGIGAVVVADVAGVPAEDDVAEAEAVLGGGEELVLMEVFAAEDAVDVGDGDFDFFVRGPGEVLQRGTGPCLSHAILPGKPVFRIDPGLGSIQRKRNYLYRRSR
jgi:hypothetical protein